MPLAPGMSLGRLQQGIRGLVIGPANARVGKSGRQDIGRVIDIAQVDQDIAVIEAGLETLSSPADRGQLPSQPIRRFAARA